MSDSNLTLPDDDSLINESERRALSQLAPDCDWYTCSFCDSAPSTHVTSADDYVCSDCWVQFESYLSHAWGTCVVCGRAMDKDGSCNNCEFEAWKANHN